MQFLRVGPTPTATFAIRIAGLRALFYSATGVKLLCRHMYCVHSIAVQFSAARKAYRKIMSMILEANESGETLRLVGERSPCL